jgi:hypothetical protein
MRHWTAYFLILLNIALPLIPRNEAAPMPAQPFALGVHTLITGLHTSFPRQGWGEHLRYARQMTGAGGWVAQVVQITDLDPAKWRAFLEHCAALELRPVLRLATAHDPGNGHWAAPDNTDGYRKIARDWAAFFESLQLEHPVWVVVGNEPNSGGEWGGQVDPGSYARYFVKVAHALHETEAPLYIAPAALDLYAPHTNYIPFPETTVSMMDAAAFWDSAFAAEPLLMKYADFWATHLYPTGPFKGAPWEHQYKFDRIQGSEWLPIINPPGGIYNRGVNGFEWEHWYLTNVHHQKMPPMLITEFGYRYRESIDPQARDTLGAELDSNIAAAYLDMALYGNADGRYDWAPRSGWTPLVNTPKLMGVIVFALGGEPSAWGHTNLLQVDSQGRVLGTYPAYDVLVQRENTHEKNISDPTGADEPAVNTATPSPG